MWEKIKTPIKEILTLLKQPESIIMVTAMIALILSQKHATFGILDDEKKFVERRFFEGVWYIVLPFLVSIFILKKNPLRFGMIGVDWKNSLFYFGLMTVIILPLVFVASKIDAFVDYYPQYKATVNSWQLFAYYEVAMLVYFTGWEYLYRGFLLFSLRDKFGDFTAILIQTLPFAVLHLRKPEIEAFCSIIAGIILGVIALRCKSIWPGVITHFLAAGYMDYLAIVIRRAGM